MKEGMKNYRKTVVKQMLQLATAGFGLVTALAWNELIKSLIEEYIKKRISIGSGIASQAVYALVITALAVFITLQLSEIIEKLDKEE